VNILDRMQAARRVAAVMEAAREEPGVYLVGGAVRDLILEKESLDVDLAVEGDAVAAARRMAERLDGEVRAYDRFGTATVTTPDVSFDLATTRREHYPEPGALPEVQAAPLDEDLLRRDFTVNALAAGPDGEVIAPPGALEDLENGTLRVFHDASFRDDPTRLLRLARYSARLGFDIEPETSQLARTAVTHGAPRTVSAPRNGAELRLMARETSAVDAFDRAWGLGVLECIDDRLDVDPRIARAGLDLAGGAERAAVAMAACCLRFDGDGLGAWLDWLEFPAPEREAIVEAAIMAPSLSDSLLAARTNSEIAEAIGRKGVATVALAGALGDDAAARKWIEELRHVKLEITGDDLVAAGIEAGPAIGRGLKAALAAKLDGKVSSRDEELHAALAAA
jgi:tRNA nucleotidyltransferase (CCA-adding enzyme)